MQSYGWRVCGFTSLDDLPAKDWRYRLAILAAIERAGRFSCFDVPVKGTGAKNIDYIIHDSGWIERTWGAYPWVNVELSAKGKAALASQNTEQPKEQT